VALHQQENTRFSVERERRAISVVEVFFEHKGIIAAVKRVMFVSDRVSYIILRRCWFHIIVLMFMLQQRMKLMI
jgi:hypothetical protein